MNIKFEYRFEKDLQVIKDKKLLSKIKKIIIDCQNSENITKIKNIKKIRGYILFFASRQVIIGLASKYSAMN